MPRPVDHVKRAYGSFERAEKLTGIPKASFYTAGRPKEKRGADGVLEIRRAAICVEIAERESLDLTWNDMRPPAALLDLPAAPARGGQGGGAVCADGLRPIEGDA